MTEDLQIYVSQSDLLLITQRTKCDLLSATVDFAHTQRAETRPPFHPSILCISPSLSLSCCLVVPSQLVAQMDFHASSVRVHRSWLTEEDDADSSRTAPVLKRSDNSLLFFYYRPLFFMMPLTTPPCLDSSSPRGLNLHNSCLYAVNSMYSICIKTIIPRWL